MLLQGDPQAASLVRHHRLQVQMNVVWSKGFAKDALSNGSRRKSMLAAGNVAQGCVKIKAGHRLSDGSIVMYTAADFRPAVIGACGNSGPEFTFYFSHRAFGTCVKHLLFEPARPTQNHYTASFDGKLLDKDSNEHWFAWRARTRGVIKMRCGLQRDQVTISYRRVPQIPLLSTSESGSTKPKDFSNGALWTAPHSTGR